LLIKQAGDHPFDILEKVSAQGDGSAVNAGLDFSTEKRLPRVLPVTVISDQFHRPAHLPAAGIDTEITQQLKRR
jgi:hypothetical protein